MNDAGEKDTGFGHSGLWFGRASYWHLCAMNLPIVRFILAAFFYRFSILYLRNIWWSNQMSLYRSLIYGRCHGVLTSTKVHCSIFLFIFRNSVPWRHCLLIQIGWHRRPWIEDLWHVLYHSMATQSITIEIRIQCNYMMEYLHFASNFIIACDVAHETYATGDAISR